MPPEICQLDFLLRSEDVAERRDAAERLSRNLEFARELSVALTKASGDEDEEVREWCVAALEALESPVPDDLGDLANLLNDPHSNVGYWAATLIGRSGRDGAAVAGDVAAALSAAPQAAVRERAAWALARLDDRTPAVLSALESACASNEPRLARLAGKALEALRD